MKACQLENFLPGNFPNKLENRSGLPEVFLRKGVPKIYSKFTVEHPYQSLRKSVPKTYSKFTGKYPCRGVISIKLPALHILHFDIGVFL